MKHWGIGFLVILALPIGTSTQAEVVIETVTVGNPGNAGEWSGEGAGGDAPDRICGAVDYAYNIGKFEVTARQYTEFLNAVAAEDTYRLYTTRMADPSDGMKGCNIQAFGLAGSRTYSVDSDWADRPVNYVSWGDAARFANWLHNGQPTGVQDLTTTEDGSYYLDGARDMFDLHAVTREDNATWVIPSEDEWYKAAYHYNDGITGNYYDYPTSSDSVPGYVNDSGNLSGTGETFTEGGTDPGNYATFDGDVGTDGIGSPYYRTEVGEWENSESPYGTFDQGGNVWEWNEAALYSSYRGLRGGSFYSGANDLHAATRYLAHPVIRASFVGFRVAKVPEPATCGNGVVDGSEECEPPGSPCCDASCYFGPVGTSCDDGETCNGVEACDEDGVCVSQVIEDCNENEVEDSCDIEDGTSRDWNDNGIPDECEPVYVDIKPGSCPNPVNPRSNGVLPMAIVGSDLFDVTQIDVDSLTLTREDGVGGVVTPLPGPPGPGIATEDVATPFTDDLCDCHEMGGDGIDDLLLKFSTPELAGAFQLSELPSGASMMLTLSGSLLDGTAFEASDCIVIPGKSARAGRRGSRKRE